MARNIRRKMRIGCRGVVYKQIKIGNKRLVIFKRNPELVSENGPHDMPRLFRCAQIFNAKTKAHLKYFADGITPAHALAAYIFKYYGVKLERQPRKRTIYRVRKHKRTKYPFKTK